MPPSRRRREALIAVALAAGEGRRMRPLSQERPKSVIPTLDVPQLSWTLARIADVHPKKTWVNAHYFLDQIESTVSHAAQVLSIDINVSLEEKEPLGTGGALRKLRDELDGTFIVASSDIATDFPFSRLIEAHQSSGALATLLAIPTDEQADFLIEEGWIGDLVDSRTVVHAGHTYGNLGVFEPELLTLIPEGPVGLSEAIFEPLMAADRGIAVVEWDGYWFNVSSPADHLNVNLEALSGLLSSDAISRFNSNAISHEAIAHVGEGAVIDDVEMRHTVVGREATVAPGTVLERCVVWSGSQIMQGVYRDAVITPSQIVPAR